MATRRVVRTSAVFWLSIILLSPLAHSEPIPVEYKAQPAVQLHPQTNQGVQLLQVEPGPVAAPGLSTNPVPQADSPADVSRARASPRPEQNRGGRGRGRNKQNQKAANTSGTTQSLDALNAGVIKATYPIFPPGYRQPTRKLSDYRPIMDPDSGCSAQGGDRKSFRAKSKPKSAPGQRFTSTDGGQIEQASRQHNSTIMTGVPVVGDKAPKGSFTVIVPNVHRRLATNSSMDPGMKAMLKTFNKYPQWNISMPDESTHGKRDIEGVVKAVPANNFAEYVSPVTVGGQLISLAFDSGSSDLWVFSSKLPAQSKGKHATYDPALSRDSRMIPGSNWQIKYGDGSGASGTVYLDTVSIGGISVTNQAVEVATRVSPEFVMDPGTDGLLGLGFSRLNTVRPKRQTTFFENVAPSLTYPIFSVDLSTDDNGSFQFGNVDPSRYRGKLAFVPVNSAEGFWEIPSNKFAIGDTVYTNRDANPAIADTGTSLLLVDQAVADRYYSQVPGSFFNRNAGGFVYPCSATLPNFSVQIGDTYFATIPGDLITFSRTRSGNCFGGVQGNGKGKMQIYGDLLFRAQYVVFDAGSRGQPALQIAPKF